MVTEANDALVDALLASLGGDVAGNSPALESASLRGFNSAFLRNGRPEICEDQRKRALCASLFARARAAHGGCGSEELLERPLLQLAQLLRAMRILMRDPVGSEKLVELSCLGFCLSVASGCRDAYGAAAAASASASPAAQTQQRLLGAAWLEAMGCVVNAVAENKVGLQHLLDLSGDVQLVHALEVPAPAPVLRYVCRALLHLCSKDKSALPKLVELGVVRATVLALAACVRAREPPFPHGAGRMDLTEELLKLMFMLGSELGGARGGEGEPSMTKHLTQLGMILAEILLLPNDRAGVYGVKLQVVNLLVHMPGNYSFFLVANGAVQPLLDLLEREVFEARVTRVEPNARLLLPILRVLLTVCEKSVVARELVSCHIFPPIYSGSEEESDVRAAAAEAEGDGAAVEAEEAEKGNDGDAKPKRNKMEPADAPPGTLRWHLIKEMASSDANIARCTSDLLYSVCEEHTQLFMHRCGLGNALGFLQRKGMIKLGDQ